MDTFSKVLHYDDSGTATKFLILKDSDDTFKWQFDGKHFIAIGTNFWMDVPIWINSNGGKVQVYAASVNNDNQKWFLISRGSKST